jgi:hypothetical protein
MPREGGPRWKSSMREGNGASGIKIEGELMIAEMSCRPKLFRSPTGSLAQAVGFEPAFHPDVAAFGFPDFGEFEGAATARALKKVIAKASLNPLTPSEVLEGDSEGFQVEERGLEAKSFEGGAGDLCKLAFDVAGIEASVAHELHPLWGKMGDEARDEVEGGAGDDDALTGVSIRVPVGDLLTVVANQV